jgi:hypothetical protein
MKPTDALDIFSDFRVKAKDRLWQDVVRENIAISNGGKFMAGNLVNLVDQLTKEKTERQENATIESLARVGVSAECFFIKDEMTDLVLFASQKLDDTDLIDTELAPSDRGFAYFEKPIPLTDVRGRTMLINVITWEKGLDKNGIAGVSFSCWNDTAKTPDEFALEIIAKTKGNKDYESFVRRLGRFHWTLSTSATNGTIVGTKQLELSEEQLKEIRRSTYKNSYGVVSTDNLTLEVADVVEKITKMTPLERNKLSKDDATNLQNKMGFELLSDDEWENYKQRIITSPTNITRILHAYWLLMSQTIVEKAKETGDRTQRRRLARESAPSEVVVIQFRKRKYYNEKGEETEDSKKIDWSHRWLVGGHWRWQPYKDPVSGGEIKKRIWISPYVKGPEDKPLVMKERVYVLAK